MTDEQRQSVYSVLLGDVSKLAPSDPARLALECFAAAEVNELEPLIDGFIAEARRERQRAA